MVVPVWSNYYLDKYKLQSNKSKHNISKSNWQLINSWATVIMNITNRHCGRCGKDVSSPKTLFPWFLSFSDFDHISALASKTAAFGPQLWHSPTQWSTDSTCLPEHPCTGLQSVLPTALNIEHLAVPTPQSKTSQAKLLSSVVPWWWNKLPNSACSAATLPIFKKDRTLLQLSMHKKGKNLHYLIGENFFFFFLQGWIAFIIFSLTFIVIFSKSQACERTQTKCDWYAVVACRLDPIAEGEATG